VRSLARISLRPDTQDGCQVVHLVDVRKVSSVVPKGEIIALYVGKAANLWNRMQTHWCRPGERGWINSFLEDVDRGDLDDIVMACAWKEGERAGVEARLIKTLKPRYCRRAE